MQFHNANIHQAAGLLEEALGYRVNVNLYMTPENSQGFEVHFDWMDGILLQVVGKKYWKVYSPTQVAYPRPDLVFKPIATHINHTEHIINSNNENNIHNKSRSDSAPLSQDFMFHSGDLIYIPRGISHEAATNDSIDTNHTLNATDTANNNNNNNSNNLTHKSELSLHLTFGIEVATHYSVEMLCHHMVDAIPMTSSPTNTKSIKSFADGSGLFTLMASAAPEVPKSEISFDVTALTKDLLHYSISRAASLTDDPGSSFLRKALGVTVLSIEVPFLSPVKVLPIASLFILEHYQELADKSLLTPYLLMYLAQKQLLRIRLKPIRLRPTSKDSSLPSPPLVFHPPKPPNNSLAADYGLRYLDRFIYGHHSDRKNNDSELDSPRRWWYDLVVKVDNIDEFASLLTSSNNSVEVETGNVHYTMSGLRNLLDRNSGAVNGSSWPILDRVINTGLGLALGAMADVGKHFTDKKAKKQSSQNSDTKDSMEYDEEQSFIFCRGWAAFMADIRTHRKERHVGHFQIFLTLLLKVIMLLYIV